eukprot:1145008-Pelagomonas_calceolata.AAC.4
MPVTKPVCSEGLRRTVAYKPTEKEKPTGSLQTYRERKREAPVHFCCTVACRHRDWKRTLGVHYTVAYELKCRKKAPCCVWLGQEMM